MNLFVPGHATSEPAALSAYVQLLEKEASDLGTDLGAPSWDDDAYEAKLEVLLADPPPLVSFTFGLPRPMPSRRCRRREPWWRSR